MRSTDVVVKNSFLSTAEYQYRTPIKFGGFTLDRATILDVQIEVESAAGKRAMGRGSMPLGNVWAFPSPMLTYEQTLDAMKCLAERVGQIYVESAVFGHPIEITWQLEDAWFREADRLSAERNLPTSIPRLATLVSASPFDAALHDAFGKLHGRNVYHTYSQEFLDNDLGRFLGAEFQGIPLDRDLTEEPVEDLPLYHLVGALDPIFPGDVVQPIHDGLPESLVDWIRRDGLTHLKIKLNGDDLEWDVQRVLDVHAAALEARGDQRAISWQYSLDFNERCRTVEYLLGVLKRLRVCNEMAFARIAYIEQPTQRDLAADRSNEMHAASALIPVVIDESLIDLESLRIAAAMGYTGAALKACKGQTQSVVLAAAAGQMGMSLCVQDLTCPGGSLIQSASLASHVRGVTAIEANSRQYCPAANVGWEARFPGIFRIQNGVMPTGQLNGVGLGAYPVE